MGRIPTYERKVGPSATPIPYSTGEGYEAPGKAMAYQARRMEEDAQRVRQIGGMVSQALGAIGSLAGKAEAERNALDMYQTKVALMDFQGQQDMAQMDHDANISGDGRDHTATRLSGFDSASGDLYGKLPANEKARQFAAERIASLRADYGTKTYGRQQAHLQGYYAGETGRLVQERVLPQITGDLASVEAGLKGVDGILADMPGATEQTRAKIRDAALDLVYKHWLDKAGPNAAALSAKVIEDYKATAPPEPQKATVAEARQLAALVPIHKGLTRGDPDRNIDGLTKPMVSSLARMLNDMPPELRKHLEINEAQRSKAYQGRLYARYQSGGGLAAPPGRSRHNFGEAVDFSPPGGYGSKYDRQGYNAALKWMYANSERYGLVNPSGIRGRDPHHFQLAPGVRDGGPVQVAGTAATPRTLFDEFKGRVVENAPAIERFALQRDRAERAAEAQAVRKQHDDIDARATEMWNKQELTKEWVEQNGALMDPKAYGRWMRVFDNTPRVTDPQTYAELAEIAHADPAEAQKRAVDAYANRQLDADGYRSIMTKANRALEPSTRMPQWARETRNAVSKMLKPDGTAGAGEAEAYRAALEKFDKYVEEQGEAVDRKGVAAFAEQLVKDHKMDGVRESRKALPMPRFGSVGRDVMSMEALEIAKQRTVEAYKAGKIDRETLSREAGLLKKWQGALEAQAAAEGKPVKPTAPAAKPNTGSGKPNTVNEQAGTDKPAMKIEINPAKPGEEQATP